MSSPQRSPPTQSQHPQKTQTTTGKSAGALQTTSSTTPASSVAEASVAADNHVVDGRVVYAENVMNLSLLDPPRFGWTAIGGISDLLPPHERARRKCSTSNSTTTSGSRSYNTVRSKRKRNRNGAFVSSDVKASPAVVATAAVPPVVGVSTTTTGCGLGPDGKKKSNAELSGLPSSATAAAGTATGTATAEFSNLASNTSSQPPDDGGVKGAASCKEAPTTNRVVGDTGSASVEQQTQQQHENTTGPIHFRALQSDGTLDIFTYHRGREGMELREQRSGSLRCDVEATDTNHGLDEPKMTVSIQVKFPIEDIKGGPPHQTDYQPRYYIDTVSWDLSAPHAPTPIAYAMEIAENFGLSYSQTMELAESIQTQLQSFVNDCCSYAHPLPLKTNGDEKPSRFVPHLYGDPGSAMSGRINPRSSSHHRKGNSAHHRNTGASGRGSRGGKSGGESARKGNRRESKLTARQKVEQAYSDEVRKRLRWESVLDVEQKGKEATENAIGSVALVENTICHICHGQPKRCGQFACGKEGHALCESHFGELGLIFPSDGSSLVLDYCPICACICACSACSHRLETAAANLKKKALEQGATPESAVFDDFLSYSLKIEPKRRLSGPAPKRGGGRWGKKKKTSVHRPKVAQVPAGEFPREIFNGTNLDPATYEDYRMIFTERGPAAPSTPAAQMKKNASNACTGVEDCSVDFCIVCKDVGNLLCCDSCPRAYHNDCMSTEQAPENNDTPWQCPGCVREQDELPEDSIDGKASRAKINAVFKDHPTDPNSLRLLSMFHGMINRLKNYDFGFMFAEPVDCTQVKTYRNFVKKPMDLGTIDSKLIKGRYRDAIMAKKGNVEDVVLAVLKDIELVWHNCFLFNTEGSAVYRMAEVQRKRALAIRKLSFDDLLSERVKHELEEYIKSCEVERDKLRRENGTTDSATERETAGLRHQARRKISVTGNGVNGRPIAALDPESGTIAKVYATMQSTYAALKLFASLKYDCEWDSKEIDSTLKVRKIIVESSNDPRALLFGYRWVFLDDLKTGKIAFESADESAEKSRPSSSDKDVRESAKQSESLEEKLGQEGVDGAALQNTDKPEVATGAPSTGGVLDESISKEDDGMERGGVDGLSLPPDASLSADMEIDFPPVEAASSQVDGRTRTPTPPVQHQHLESDGMNQKIGDELLANGLVLSPLVFDETGKDIPLSSPK